MSDYACIVVGLGPAGSTVLRDLSLSGVRVLGIDKAVFPRVKPCGGALSSLAQRQITVPNWEHLAKAELNRVRLSLKCGREITHTTNQPICRFVMRDQFDAFLLDAAIKDGAIVRDGVEVFSVEATPQGVIVNTNNGRFTAQCLVGCDGANSQVARSLNLALQPSGAALEAEITAPQDVADQWKDSIYLSLATPNSGYGWVFPKDGHMSVGVGSFTPRTPHLRPELERLISHAGLQHLPRRIAGHLIPKFSARRPIQSGRVILAGDAAGFLDPLSGEGIAYALMSGHIAAHHIYTYLNGTADSLGAYQVEIKETIGRELGMAQWIAGKVYRFPATFFWFLEHSPETLALYCQVISGDTTYRRVVQHLKRQFLRFGVMRPGQKEDLPV